MTAVYPKAGRDDWAMLFHAGALGILTDAELLARFTRESGDPLAEAAFAALLDRHGPLVLGVCRRILGDHHAAEDAFQAVFLVLARKALSLRLGAEDSLGRWLYKVSLRVARRARAVSERRPRIATGLDGIEPIDPPSTLAPCDRDDLRALIDAEIARLPARYQSAVVLCHLEGLSQEQAARRLRCPVGTVQSRLHRARQRLRSGLARRGLAPAVGALAGLLERTSRAAVPPQLVNATATAAVRISAGELFAGAVPAGVTGLAGFILRRMIMRQCTSIAALVALGLAMSGGAVALATGGGDEPKTERRTADSKAKPQALDPNAPEERAPARPEPPLAEQLEQVKGEYESLQRALGALYRGSAIPEENQAKAAEIRPDLPAVVRRIAELASSAPDDPAVRDAMLWVVQKTMRSDHYGVHAGEFMIASNWLLRHFGDDPDAIRVSLEFDNWPTANRDQLLLGFYASAKGRESKGLARLALAQYLETKAKWAEGSRNMKDRPTRTHDDLVRADGTLYSEKEVMPDEEYAYRLSLKQCDVDYLRSEADRLYEEVIADYGDVPYVRSRDRQLEALLKQPNPLWNGQPIPVEEKRRMETALARRRSTLGQVAEARLDDWHNLAVGKIAPEIQGLDLDGKPLKLSDFRGKVLAVVFWGTWCGPCMREIPREKALVERMKGRPFAMLGVDTDADAEVARKVVQAQGISWPNWHDLATGLEPGAVVSTDGPIAKLYHIRGYPTVYVIDAEGRIRDKKAYGAALDALVEKLVAEKEAADE